MSERPYYGHADRFRGLDADTLFAVEEERGEPDDVHDYVRGLLVLLADWREQVLGGRREMRRHAMEREEAAYTEALNATREAFLQWHFRALNGPRMPDVFDLPPRRAER